MDYKREEKNRRRIIERVLKIRKKNCLIRKYEKE
jgi:hypothetical protein